MKRVYTNTSLSEGKLSVASLAESRINEFCARQRHVTAVLVGAGKMIEQVGTFLAKTPNAKLIFVNRTKERSDELMQRFGGSSMSLESFFADRPHFDVLATRHPRRPTTCSAPPSSPSTATTTGTTTSCSSTWPSRPTWTPPQAGWRASP